MMKNETKVVNDFLRKAEKQDVDFVLSCIILTERQLKIFEMYFVKGFNIGYIADTLFVSSTVVSRELCRIRRKLYPLLRRQENANK